MFQGSTLRQPDAGAQIFEGMLKPISTQIRTGNFNTLLTKKKISISTVAKYTAAEVKNRRCDWRMGGHCPLSSVTSRKARGTLRQLKSLSRPESEG